MFDPGVTARAREQLEVAFAQPLQPLPLTVARSYATDLAPLWDPETASLTRALTPEEQAVVINEQLLCQIDFRYMAERYLMINKGLVVEPLAPFWTSQELVLAQLAAIERKQADGYQDGALICTLKARQLGVSSLAAALCLHQTVTQPNRRALVASDVTDSSAHLFSMAELMYRKLPWYLKPPSTKYVTSGEHRHLAFLNESAYQMESGKAMRGQKVEDSGEGKGEIGRGKSQPLDARLLTPTGWTLMGLIRVGDLVIASDGRPTAVLGVYPQGLQPTYQVTFTDGSVTTCSADHLWTVRFRDRSERRVGPWETLPLSELQQQPLRGHKEVYRIQIPQTEPVAFCSPDVLPLDPYLMGFLIGDGCLTKDASFSSDDASIVERVAQVLPDGHRVRQRSKYDYSIVGSGQVGGNHVLRALQTLGLNGCRAETKHIPPCYLLASPTERVKLLQGLFDADGWVTESGAPEFSTVSRALCEDVTFLVEALGGSVRQRPPRRGKYTYKGERREGQLAYRLAVRLPRAITPFWLARKRNKYKAPPVPSRYIASVEYLGLRESQCIKVANRDQLYLTDRCIVTHNTWSAIHLSELATWENPEQIDSALFPGLPVAPYVIGLLESTAKGRYNWWHRQWQASMSGSDRFSPVFIPWFAEPEKWRLRPPADWTPADATLSHARLCEDEGPRWLGRAVSLTRDQLYWYERARATAESKEQLASFLAEYPATPEECFQYSGRSIFSLAVRERIKAQARKVESVWLIEPAAMAQERAELVRSGGVTSV